MSTLGISDKNIIQPLGCGWLRAHHPPRPALHHYPHALAQRDFILGPARITALAGKDLRRTPVEERKRALVKLVRRALWALRLNEHIVESGDIVFRHACKLGFDGIVSKRLGSPYVSGRSRHWVKSKNPASPAVKREAEEDWGKGRWG
jgi:hypothetical protein